MNPDRQRIFTHLQSREDPGQGVDLKLWRWSTRGERENRRIVSITVDWRAALGDALLGHNVDAKAVADEFERLCLDPEYTDE